MLPLVTPWGSSGDEGTRHPRTRGTSHSPTLVPSAQKPPREPWAPHHFGPQVAEEGASSMDPVPLFISSWLLPRSTKLRGQGLPTLHCPHSAHQALGLRCEGSVCGDRSALIRLCGPWALPRAGPARLGQKLARVLGVRARLPVPP